MKRTIFGILLATLVLAPVASAQMQSLTYGEDYTLSDEVQAVTTVRVSPNRVDHYLAGLSKTSLLGKRRRVKGLRFETTTFPSSTAVTLSFDTCACDLETRTSRKVARPMS